jgi:hypothetical protein
MCPVSPIRHFDHVGVTVRDLGTVTAFFVGLGFETEGRTVLEGWFLDTVTGPNELGLRNVTFEVGDLQAILGRLAADRCSWVSQRMPWPVPMTPAAAW